MTNTLYCGDNLEALRGHVPDASVDLINRRHARVETRTSHKSVGQGSLL